jgi:hypothetical protein
LFDNGGESLLRMLTRRSLFKTLSALAAAAAIKTIVGCSTRDADPQTARRAVAAALGITYEQLTRDLSAVDYSSIRRTRGLKP